MKLYFCFLILFVYIFKTINGVPIRRKTTKAPSPTVPTSNETDLDTGGQLYYPPSQSFQRQGQYSVINPSNPYYPAALQNLPPELSNRRTSNAGLLLPNLQYAYNITHPPRPGVVLTHNQLQYLGQQQLQQPPPLSISYQRRDFAPQQVQNGPYSPVVIGGPQSLQVQAQPQDIVRIQSAVGSLDRTQAQLIVAGDEQITSVVSALERDPEDLGIGLRSGAKSRAFQGSGGASSSIVFDYTGPNQQLLNQAAQYPEKIVFTNGEGQGSQQQFRPLPTPPPQTIFSNNAIDQPANFYYNSTIRPPIQVPYITTLSPLREALLRKNVQSGLDFRSILGLTDPALRPQQLQALTKQVSAISAPRRARVQNFFVPNLGGQPQQQSQYLQSSLNPSNFNLNNDNTNNFASLNQQQQQQQQSLIQQQQQQRSFSNRLLNLDYLRGTAVTPQNQFEIGQYIFTDPNNPIRNGNTNSNNPLVASTDEKMFIIPADDENESEFDQEVIDQRTPAEVVITIVDEGTGSLSTNGQNSDLKTGTGQVLTNFSLFILPSTFRKCVKGYKKAHDGKCRLIVKLKNTYRYGTSPR